MPDLNSTLQAFELNPEQFAMIKRIAAGKQPDGKTRLAEILPLIERPFLEFDAHGRLS